MNTLVVPCCDARLNIVVVPIQKIRRVQKSLFINLVEKTDLPANGSWVFIDGLNHHY